MRRMMTRVRMVAAGAFLLGPVAAGADWDDPSALAETTIDAITDQAVRNIARRYNLNDAQREKTSELMKHGVNKFLREHHDEVWPVLRAFIAAQIDGKLPDDPREAVRIGKTALPLMKEVRKAVLEGNALWREILTDEQKKVHDIDMAEMDKTFMHLEKSIDSWAHGDPPAGGIFPPPNPAVQRIRRPRKPQTVGIPVSAVTVNPGMFEQFVKDFITQYGLDKGQADAARSILGEFKEKGQDYIKSKKAEFARVTSDRERALADLDLDGVKRADKARRALLRPIDDMFPKLEQRLVGLLTTPQLERYNQIKNTGVVSVPTPEQRRAASSPATAGAKQSGTKQHASKQAGVKPSTSGDKD